MTARCNDCGLTWVPDVSLDHCPRCEQRQNISTLRTSLQRAQEEAAAERAMREQAERELQTIHEDALKEKKCERCGAAATRTYCEVLCSRCQPDRVTALEQSSAALRAALENVLETIFLSQVHPDSIMGAEARKARQVLDSSPASDAFVAREEHERQVAELKTEIARLKWCDQHAVAQPCQFCPDERIVAKLGEETSRRSELQIEVSRVRAQVEAMSEADHVIRAIHARAKDQSEITLEHPDDILVRVRRYVRLNPAASPEREPATHHALESAMATAKGYREELDRERATSAAMRKVLTGNQRCLWCDEPNGAQGECHLPGCHVQRALAPDAGFALLAAHRAEVERLRDDLVLASKAQDLLDETYRAQLAAERTKREQAERDHEIRYARWNKSDAFLRQRVADLENQLADERAAREQAERERAAFEDGMARAENERDEERRRRVAMRHERDDMADIVALRQKRLAEAKQSSAALRAALEGCRERAANRGWQEEVDAIDRALSSPASGAFVPRDKLIHQLHAALVVARQWIFDFQGAPKDDPAVADLAQVDAAIAAVGGAPVLYVPVAEVSRLQSELNAARAAINGNVGKALALDQEVARLQGEAEAAKSDLAIESQIIRDIVKGANLEHGGDFIAVGKAYAAALQQKQERIDAFQGLLDTATRSEAVTGDVRIPVRIIFESAIEAVAPRGRLVDLTNSTQGTGLDAAAPVPRAKEKP